MAFPRIRRAAAFAGLALFASACLSATDLEERLSVSASLDQTTQIVARDGSALAALHAEIDRQVVPLAEIPAAMRDAVIAVEDRRFYSHGGVDGPAVARALARNLTEGALVEGGSTITQQLARSMLEDPQRTWKRKVREAVLARSLEQRFTKDEILERYLNTVYFGRGAYGVQAAARRFFAVPARDLTLPQAALLAGTIQAPSRIDPARDPAGARARRAHVLASMREVRAITASTERATARAPLGVIPPSQEPARAPHVVSTVVDLIGDGAAGLDVLGATRADRERRLYRGGLRITTTIDPTLQTAAEEAVASILHEDRDPQGALVSLDPADGAVRALVGGRDPFDPKVGRFNLATQARRQPGSTFKPFTLVAALEAGVDLEETFAAPAQMSLRVPGGRWTVSNYDGTSFGRLSLRRATANSVNTVYAQVALRVGADRVAEVAHRMGITTPLHAYPSIALGAQEVTPLEMAGAYGTLAAKGTRRTPFVIAKITDVAGKVLYTASRTDADVLAPSTAARATDALREVFRNGTARALDPGFPVAGKTGTTDDHRDAWFAGYSPRLVTVVWVGFAEATIPMLPPRTRVRVFGGSWPGQIWNRFMRTAHRGLPALAFSGDIQERIAVPSVLGMTFERARATLIAAGLAARAVPRYCPTVSPGAVCDQSPAAGTTAEPGSEVGLAVADDTAIGDVPSVLGMRVGTARRSLEAFTVVVEERELSEAFAGCRDPSVHGSGRVWAQNPCGGARYGSGATVTLVVNP